MVRWVVGSILHGGPIELFLVQANAPRLVYQRPWYVLSCLWDDAYKRTLAANECALEVLLNKTDLGSAQLVLLNKTDLGVLNWYC